MFVLNENEFLVIFLRLSLFFASVESNPRFLDIRRYGNGLPKRYPNAWLPEYPDKYLSEHPFRYWDSSHSIKGRENSEPSIETNERTELDSSPESQREERVRKTEEVIEDKDLPLSNQKNEELIDPDESPEERREQELSKSEEIIEDDGSALSNGKLRDDEPDSPSKRDRREKFKESDNSIENEERNGPEKRLKGKRVKKKDYHKTEELIEDDGVPLSDDKFNHKVPDSHSKSHSEDRHTQKGKPPKIQRKEKPFEKHKERDRPLRRQTIKKTKPKIEKKKDYHKTEDLIKDDGVPLSRHKFTNKDSISRTNDKKNIKNYGKDLRKTEEQIDTSGPELSKNRFTANDPINKQDKNRKKKVKNFKAIKNYAKDFTKTEEQIDTSGEELSKDRFTADDKITENKDKNPKKKEQVNFKGRDPGEEEKPKKKDFRKTEEQIDTSGEELSKDRFTADDSITENKDKNPKKKDSDSKQIIKKKPKSAKNYKLTEELIEDDGKKLSDKRFTDNDPNLNKNQKKRKSDDQGSFQGRDPGDDDIPKKKDFTKTEEQIDTSGEELAKDRFTADDSITENKDKNPKKKGKKKKQDKFEGRDPGEEDKPKKKDFTKTEEQIDTSGEELAKDRFTANDPNEDKSPKVSRREESLDEEKSKKKDFSKTEETIDTDDGEELSSDRFTANDPNEKNNKRDKKKRNKKGNKKGKKSKKNKKKKKKVNDQGEKEVKRRQHGKKHNRKNKED